MIELVAKFKNNCTEGRYLHNLFQEYFLSQNVNNCLCILNLLVTGPCENHYRFLLFKGG